MVVNLGAYATEIVRAGIEAIPHGQTEAGKALGLRPFQIFRLIILPPALRLIYPPLAGQFTMVLLGSSVVSAISANELTSVANSIQAATFKTFETYFFVTFMYLLMVLAFRAVFNLIYVRSFGSGHQASRIPGL
jgi:polar amino acid transport system permease protein